VESRDISNIPFPNWLIADQKYCLQGKLASAMLGPRAFCPLSTKSAAVVLPQHGRAMEMDGKGVREFEAMDRMRGAQLIAKKLFALNEKQARKAREHALQLVRCRVGTVYLDWANNAEDFSEEERALKRIALKCAVLLPNDFEDAREILDEALLIVGWGLGITRLEDARAPA
jgi:hypothetical protein